ncbi:hypothetical protein [Helicobacter felis]|uniref:hypothetical protein n=1 Tax=Helicobacter felis TaxID=214 RepID=UPI000CF143C3|nr:hypothetical protein [Helicobacter felis]
MQKVSLVVMLGLLGFILVPLNAENSGVYGEIGFQYSNMTQATKSQVGPQLQKNPFSSTAPVTAVNVNNFLQQSNNNNPKQNRQ